MKKLLVLSAALAASGLAMAQDIGRVISATPVMQQVGVPRQVCTTEQVAIQQPKSGAGAAIGAIHGDRGAAVLPRLLRAPLLPGHRHPTGLWLLGRPSRPAPLALIRRVATA